MASRSIHTLLVEDDEMERLSFDILLTEAGCAVTSAKNGRQAIEFISSQSFSVIVMDLFLPDVLSLDIIPILKSHQPGIKIILMTADIREEYSQRATNLGVDAYLLKPISPEDLIAIIHRFSQSS